MSFLTIPSQEALFRPIKISRSAGEGDARLADDDDDDDDDEDDEGSENVRLIPRCSPVPRKRGASIHDETAEYMRIQAALSPGKRVSFADTTGGDLVDVREFVAFDSEDDEDDLTRWNEERAKFGRAEPKPVFHVHPDFAPPGKGALLETVSAQKVCVEHVGPVEQEPLAFSGLVRVLNISFHKAVYIRSTMDNWETYFDHPAEYVPGSHDGHTDKFSFKLSFAPPYVTHGSRIEFVVRYETTEGDHWDNNLQMNYAMSLLLSYEEELKETDGGRQQVRGIMRPPKDYRTCIDTLDTVEDATETCRSESEGHEDPCSVITQPHIDKDGKTMLEELDGKVPILQLQQEILN